MASSHCHHKPIRFFKIVLSDIGSHSQLTIPGKFARIFENLDDSKIFLNVPSGSVWSVDLEKHKGKVWLQNGWPEFANFYSIGFGYLLVFEYKGDSKVQVLIFDRSSSEIDYALASGEKLNFARSTHVKKRVIDIDDLTMSSDDGVEPCKKMKTNSPCIEEKLQQEAKGNGDRALALAKAYKSKNPFFIQSMKPSNVMHRSGFSVYVTRTFEVAYKNWKNNDKLILQVAERTWAVYCSLDLNFNQCRIRRGWVEFVQDNSLNVCDVCVFELINPAEKLFQVIIFRATEERNCEKNRRSPRVKSEAEDPRVLVPISVKTSAGSSSIEAFRKGPKLQLENEYGDGKSASNKDRDRALASAQAFKSKNPFFITVMQPFHVNGGGTGLYISKTFKESYEKWKNHDEVIFQVAGRTWQVYCNLNSGLNQCRISGGWTAFARENSMNVGDVCVFELINPSRKLFNVSIFRPENETNLKGNNSLPKIKSKPERLSSTRSKPEQARVHSSVNDFKSKNPFFTVNVCPSYLYGGSMSLPKKFINRYITKNSCNVILQLSDGRAWSVKCHVYNFRAKFIAGWKLFAQENKLAAGDVCVFELIDSSKKLFNVVIL